MAGGAAASCSTDGSARCPAESGRLRAAGLSLRVIGSRLGRAGFWPRRGGGGTRRPLAICQRRLLVSGAHPGRAGAGRMRATSRRVAPAGACQFRQSVPIIDRKTGVPAGLATARERVSPAARLADRPICTEAQDSPIASRRLGKDCGGFSRS